MEKVQITAIDVSILALKHFHMLSILLNEKFTCKTSSKFLIILTNYSCESIDVLREYKNYTAISNSTYTRSAVIDND